jgi:peptide/nickel transport system substrate-binding protein
VIDPIWTTQTIANIHGALIYDTLFGNDGDQKPQPQMVGKYEISPDRLTYSFTLRDGLKFHDGSPVTTKDVIASIKRWGAKDGVGQRLMGYVTEMKAADDKTFTMTLKEPYGMVLESLGKSGSSIAAIMREKEALTDPQTQVKESIGSGPYIFAKDQWVPAARRSTSRTRTTGRAARRRRPSPGQDPGRRPHRAGLDLRSADRDVGARQRRDRLLENPSTDFLPILEKAKGVKLMKTGKIDSTQGMIRLNHLHPPFDNIKARQAMYYLINQEDYLRAIIGDPKYYRSATAC